MEWFESKGQRRVRSLPCSCTPSKVQCGCSVGARMVQCGCKDGTVWVQGWCSVGARMVQCGCKDGAVWVQGRCSVGARMVQCGRKDDAVWALTFEEHGMMGSPLALHSGHHGHTLLLGREGKAVH